MNTEKQSFDPRASFVDVHILVVDDDATSLAIVSAMLRTWKYQVTTAKNPVDALATLRTKKEYFELVITDLHMPYMDGFELKKRVDEEFKLPVIMMSADEKESVIIKCLEGGVAFYLVKPVNPVDLKNVWQYAIAAKKGKSIAIDENIIGSSSHSTSSVVDHFGESSFVDKRPLSSHDFGDINNGNKEKGHNDKKGDSNKKRGTKRGKEDGEEEIRRRHQPFAPRKAKVIWTNSLHTCFLMAIGDLGLDKAVPKKILEFMNVPGLTRENVASHLQKYRLFLKKVAEKGMANITKTQLEKVFKSSFANGHTSQIFKTYQKQYPDLLRQYQLLNSSKTRQSSLTCSNTSTSRSVPRQSNTQTISHHQPLLGNTTPLNYHANIPSAFGNGGTSFGLLNPTTGYAHGFNSHTNGRGNSMQVFQQQNLASPGLFTNSPLSYDFHSTTSGFGNTRPSTTNINANQIVVSNFAGTKVSNSGGDELIGFNQSSGFVNVAPMGNNGNTNYGYFEKGESSFSNSGTNKNANYQLASVNSPNSNEQNTTLEYLLQSPTNQLYGLSNIVGVGGGNKYEFQDKTYSSAAFNGNFDIVQQFNNDDDFIELFLNEDTLNDQPPSDQQQSEELPSDTSDVTFQSDEQEMNHPENQIQDPDFSASYYLQDNVPFQQYSFVQSNEQVVLNTESGNLNMINSAGDYYYPSFGQFNYQKEEQGNYGEKEERDVYEEWDEILDALWGTRSYE